MPLLRFMRLAFCLSLLAVVFGNGKDANAQVIIELQPQAAVSNASVRIEDIAELVGGDVRNRSAMSRLDLESLEQRLECSITANQVASRLRLAGFSRSDFRIIGASVVAVTHTSPNRIRQRLTEKMALGLSRQFAIEPSKLSITIESESQWQGMQSLFAEDDYQITLPPLTELPTGRARLTVRLTRRSKDPINVPIDVRVAYVTSVAVAVAPIARGTTVDASMITILERRLEGKRDFANPNALIGLRAARNIPANSIVLATQLIAPPASSQIVIRRNDLIDVVIPMGSGEIRLKNARAMQSGGLGETIEVLNPNSNRRINASVAGPNLATLPNPARKRR
ncbi:MAG: flagellar basal body P-ring formation chaperone FlgA [Planctomycetota bacterium]